MKKNKSRTGLIAWNKNLKTGPLTKEHKEKIKAKLLGHKVLKKTREKIRLANEGKIQSNETKKKIRLAFIGKYKNLTYEQRYGEQKSKKIRNNISLSHIGNKHSDETKKKIGLTKKGNIYRKGSIQSIETIQKIKEARKQQILPIKDTLIEIKIQNFLKELNIEFFTHQYINIEHGYQCDILIPSINLVIECDGNYWHSYPTGRDIDHIRTKELIKKGFKVLRLWEFEINKMSIEEFQRRINIK